MKQENGTLLIDDTYYNTEIPERHGKESFKGTPDPGDIRAIIPGTIIDVKVEEGQKVSSGEVLLILEAMKMYNRVESEISGRVKSVDVSAGDRVEKDQLLIVIEE